MSDDPPIEMDAISAHLDRGWNLYGRGDLLGARVSANHIIQLNPDIPDGYLLLGAVAAADGDPDEALDLLRQAMDIEPDYLDPVLYAAEIYIHRLGEVERGLELCDEAEGLAAEEKDRLDIRLLRVEAHLALGDEKQATELAAGAPEELFDDAAYNLRWGRCLLEVQELSRAVALLSRAATEPATAAEAHYYLGLALEQLGRDGEGAEHLLRSLLLDEEEEEPTWGADPEIFARLLAEAVEKLEQPLRGRIEGVPRTVRALPAVELVAEGLDPRCEVFFAARVLQQNGPDRPAPGTGEGGESELCHVFVYKRNVERSGLPAAELVEQLVDALEQEADQFYAAEGGVPGRGR